MCTELRALRQAITDWARAFDPAGLTPQQAAVVVQDCATLESSIAAVKALAAARASESRAWEREGFRSASDQLAALTGTSSGAARRTLDTGRRMAEQPDVAQAALAGAISPAQAAVIAEGVEADPSQASGLLQQASHTSLQELTDTVAKVKAAASDPEERRRRLHARRCLRRWSDVEGALQVRLVGHPEDGVTLWKAIEPIRRRLIILRRGVQENEVLPALDYDALMILASAATGTPAEIPLRDLIDLGLFPGLEALDPVAPPPPAPAAPTGSPSGPATDMTDFPVVQSLFPEPARHSSPRTVAADRTARPEPHPPDARRPRPRLGGSEIRVDLTALMRGVPIQGELCEIAGFGPVPVSVVADILATRNPFVIGVLTRAEKVVGVYHHRRRPSAHQQSALDFLYPTCAVAGCNARTGLQYDHRADWADTHFTIYDLLDRLCWHHHALKTRKNWALVEGHGKRDFVSPEDPRHPGSIKSGR